MRLVLDLIVELESGDSVLLVLFPRPTDELPQVVVLDDRDARTKHHCVSNDLACAHVRVLRHDFSALFLETNGL